MKEDYKKPDSKTFNVRVDHELGFHSSYEIPANDYHEAEGTGRFMMQ